ncbi:MAG: type III-B CRISPR module-associated Cmr3 family protein [Burkholderiales bacterium]|jgi:CRISPR-associated protein Cmr3
MMQATSFHFIEPLDVLFLRGNKLFGDPGSFGESLVPPWPSVLAGALRSQILSNEGVNFEKFAQGHVVHPSIGSISRPGTFTLEAFDLAQCQDDGTITALHAAPADLIVTRDEQGHFSTVSRIQPEAITHGLMSSSTLPMWPVLPGTQRVKPAGGIWVNDEGWRAYLAGQKPTPGQLGHASHLWKIDSRVGIGLDTTLRRAADHQLFTAQAIAFKPGLGFITAVSGATLPPRAMLRLGGDGRAASLKSVAYRAPEPDLHAIAKEGRCRIILTTPGIFTQGWLPEGSGPGHSFELGGVRARLACASLNRADVVSGWDLARQQPKTALRAVPAGSVYWLDELQAQPEQLRKLTTWGLWADTPHHEARRAEGFNRFTFAAW